MHTRTTHTHAIIHTNTHIWQLYAYNIMRIKEDLGWMHFHFHNEDNVGSNIIIIIAAHHLLQQLFIRAPHNSQIKIGDIHVKYDCLSGMTDLKLDDIIAPSYVLACL